MEIEMGKMMSTGKAAFLTLCICMLGLTACGDKSSGNTNGNKNSSSNVNDSSGTSVSINKDGSISSKIVEDFGESYYDVSGLKDMIETSISEYKATNASAQVNLKKCDVSKGATNVQMEFGDYEAYAGFNGENFFTGTIQAANQAGFDLNITLNAVSNAGDKTSVSKADLMGMGSNHIVIFDAAVVDEEEVETVRVNCFDEILYVSEGVSAVDSKSADVTLAGGYGIIVFK